MKLLSTLSTALRPETRLGRPVALTSVLALLIATVPGPALASVAKPVARFAASLDETTAAPMPPSRLLTAAAMRKAQGRAGENPYLAGQAKWDVMYKGVNLMTGNFSTSGTDLTFEGGYGIPVNVTRSYSANNPDEGPLGKGWTLSVDVRSTAGGLIKSGGAPVRAVPTAFKGRPSLQTDPNAELASGQAAQPAEAVIATDAGGTEETVQVDADGVLTTPPWDKNTNDTVYENEVLPNGDIRRRTLRNTVHTPDGTDYVYERLGTYPNGTRPWDQPNAAPEFSDVMKIVSATDRQGNVTTYHYGTADVSFQKANGLVTEKRLEWIGMPNGHRIDFAWSGNRMVSATDGYRTVQYGYTNGLLTGVTTPGGKTTTYGYAVPQIPSGSTMPPAGPVLSSVTDPRELTTTIYSTVQMTCPSPYASPWNVNGQSGGFVPGVVTYRIAQPNGVDFWSCNSIGGVPSYSGFADVPDGMESGTLAAPWWKESYGGSNGPVIAHGYNRFGGSGNIVQIMTGMPDVDSSSPVSNGSQNAYPGVNSYRQYDASTQNLVLDHRTTKPYTFADSSSDDPRQMRSQDTNAWTTDTTTSYNFMGNPLKKTVVSSSYSVVAPSVAVTQTNSVEYAYWGGDKYWQQKMVRDEGAALDGNYAPDGTLSTTDRISFTNYYPATAPQGSRGQTAKVYDAKNTVYALDASIALPYGVSPTAPNVWKYRLAPKADPHAARFLYDAKGRPTDVWKLQKATTSPYTYVQTHTTYGGDGYPSWGQANSVVEDFGGVNRTTVTSAYDSIGRAVQVQDAKGQSFHTTYDLDGVVQSVERIAGGGSTPVVTYTYGSSGLTNGQVLSVTDNLSGVRQDFGYCPSGGGLGQVAGVAESGGPNPGYSTGYTYYPSGDRETTTVTTPNGATKWRYSDYASLGEPTSSARVFRTLTKLTPGGVRTDEEMHYAYDSAGRLREAVFAQTPSASSASANGWYRNSSGVAVPAARRARAHYEYDMGGRLALVVHWWDILNSNGTAYTSQPILANECGYELSGLSRGLKTASRSYRGTPQGTWNMERTEAYGYDARNDHLLSANYGDGLANSVQSWSYDAAGNRASDSSQPGNWTYDNLNRILSSPQGTYTHDLLGNRLTGPGGAVHTWDALGRMLSLAKGGATTSYAYRADGMRTLKSSTSGSSLYRYDGQMPVETVETAGGATTVQRNALGARGTDMIERTTSTGTQTRFPLYDAHGNSVATLGRSGSSWTLGDERSYDAWGRVRQGAAQGPPSARYCASLGHVQDDESGLVYMRARYYEPGTGRFVSEDRAKEGMNWFSYGHNDPINMCDRGGQSADHIVGLGMALFGAAISIAGLLATMKTCSEAFAVGAAGLAMIVAWFSEVRFSFDTDSFGKYGAGVTLITGGSALFGGEVYIANAIHSISFIGPPALSPAQKARAVASVYAETLMLFMSLESAIGS